MILQYVEKNIYIFGVNQRICCQMKTLNHTSFILKPRGKFCPTHHPGARGGTGATWTPGCPQKIKTQKGADLDGVEGGVMKILKV